MNNDKKYSIIANAALQFIDYDLDLGVMIGNRPLARTRKPFYVGRGQKPGLNLLADLVEREDNPGEYVGSQSKEALPLHYEIEFQQAFNCCLGHWLPIPFLVRNGLWPDRRPCYGFGPTDWVRGHLSRLGGEDSLRYRLTLVFDPQVEDGSANIVTDNGVTIYHALSQVDVDNNVSFGLAAGERDNAWFINELPWVKEAFKSCREDYYRRHPKARRIAQITDAFPDFDFDDADMNSVGTEAMAIYCTFLEGLELSGQIGEVGLVNPAKATPIEVDLVLDIGNSRLTGVLVETPPRRDTKLTDCYILPVRDLSEPANIYAEPLSTQVEFAEPFFGQMEWSMKARRHKKAFPWPSTVRVGPEAARLARDSREDKGPTGMSSPKRYLWDTRQQWDMLWYLNNKYERHGDIEEPAAGRGAFLLNVNVAGVPLEAVRRQQNPGEAESRYRRYMPLPKPIKDSYLADEDDMPAFESRYSRSSLMMFLLSEIVTQALAAINNPMIREGRDTPRIPRRLSRVILTVPTAMPLVEQNIFKTWARLAVQTVWEAMGWQDFFWANPPRQADQIKDFRLSPMVRCDWDEATCTQVVWLYNEICDRFHRNARELFGLLGKSRPAGGQANGERAESPAASEVPTLRIASIDMGGGTTDLSITTYSILNSGETSPMIKPCQNFRDGFNVAGDDIMNKIIGAQFLKKVARAAAEAGVCDAESLVNDLFQDTPQDGEQPGASKRRKRLRSQFINLVAVPVALRVLKAYENTDLSGDDQTLSLSVEEVLGCSGSDDRGLLTEVMGYLENELRRAGWADFSLPGQVLTIDLREVDQNVNFVLEKVMADMSEVIKLYDCDLLILSGRPSRWPAMMRAPYRHLCIPVDRIVHIHKYRVGARYPFVTHGRIEDPKTTVVLGAIICALAEGSLEGIRIDTSNFEPQPTTRYIGMLDGHGQLDREHVWFPAIDVYDEKGVRMEATVEFNTTIPVGFRQLSSPRWTTTRLYSLEFKNSEAQRQAEGRLPYSLILEYTLEEPEQEDDGRRRPSRLRRTEGTLGIAAAVDKFGQSVRGALNVRLQTLRQDDGYWLDTGVLDNN